MGYFETGNLKTDTVKGLIAAVVEKELGQI